jgi:hypothetical protein
MTPAQDPIPLSLLFTDVNEDDWVTFVPKPRDPRRSQPARVPGSPTIRQTLLGSIIFWLGCMIGLAVLTYFAVLLPIGNTAPYHPIAFALVTWRHLADAWNNGDGLIFYLPLAVHGYQNATHAESIQANFFPLYPGMVHVVWLLTGKRHLVGSGLAVADLGALATITGLAFLARLEGATRLQMQRVLIIAIIAQPLAFFLFAPYPTSWLVACVTWSLFAARSRSWAVAALLAAVACLLHPTGVVLWPALLVEFASQHRWRLGTALQWLPHPHITLQGAIVAFQFACVVVSVPDGIGLYAAYCQRVYGDSLAFLHTQEHWFQHTVRWPWQTIQLVIRNFQQMPTTSYGQARLLVDLVPWLFSIAVLVYALYQRHRGLMPIPTSFLVLWTVLIALSLILPVVGTLFPDVIVAAGRYLLVAVPVPLVLAFAADRHPHALQLALYIGLILQVILCSMYLVTGSWIV